MKELLAQRFNRFLGTHSSGRFLLAISGGCDSMVMLDLARRFVEKDRLVVAHFNHKLRGRAANADEALVQQWCETHQVHFYRSERKRTTVSELSLREERLQFLKETAKMAKCDF